MITSGRRTYPEAVPLYETVTRRDRHGEPTSRKSCQVANGLPANKPAERDQPEGNPQLAVQSAQERFQSPNPLPVATVCGSPVMVTGSPVFISP